MPPRNPGPGPGQSPQKAREEATHLARAQARNEATHLARAQARDETPQQSAEHPVLTRVARPPDATVPTGERPTDVYDLWHPQPHLGARGVTVALVHGGFWRAAYDRTHLAPLACALADDGYWVANLEYPRVGMTGGGFPGTTDAVSAQVAALETNPELPDVVVAVGHSAGGHLVLWLASHRPRHLAGAVALAPAADLGEVDRLGLSAGAARDFLGCAPAEDPQAWARADPARARLQIPAVVLAGSGDDLIPASVIAAYRASRRREEPVTFDVVDGDHFDLIDPAQEAYRRLLGHLHTLTADLG